MEGGCAAPEPAPALAVAGTVVALSMAGGGYSGLAVGAATATVWVLVLGALLTRRGAPAPDPAWATAALMARGVAWVYWAVAGLGERRWRGLLRRCATRGLPWCFRPRGPDGPARGGGARCWVGSPRPRAALVPLRRSDDGQAARRAVSLGGQRAAAEIGAEGLEGDPAKDAEELLRLGMLVEQPGGLPQRQRSLVKSQPVDQRARPTPQPAAAPEDEPREAAAVREVPAARSRAA